MLLNRGLLVGFASGLNTSTDLRVNQPRAVNMNKDSKSKFGSPGANRWATSHGMSRGGSGMGGGMSSSGMSGMGGYGMTRSDEQPATTASKDDVQNRADKSKGDPTSYSLQTTTVQEQASKESNFIGSAWFYNLSINQVKLNMTGEYVIVYARPKTSKSFPGGEGTESFDPNFQNRIEIKTERPKEGGHEANRIGYLITNKGFFGVGALYFHGRKIDLYFEPPWQNNKFESIVQTETWTNQRHIAKPSAFLDEVLDCGIRDSGTVAQFGMKDMVTMFNLPHGFYFIALDLAVWNLKTGGHDIHHIVGVKIPEKGEVSSAFILKQPIEFPHYTWLRWQDYHAQEEKRRNAILPGVDKEISGYYEEEPDMRDRKGKKNVDSMDWTDVI